MANLPTEWGDFKIAGYRSLISDEDFVALFKGEMSRDVPTLVRIHSQCLTGDVVALNGPAAGRDVEQAAGRIEHQVAVVRDRDQGTRYHATFELLNAQDRPARPSRAR